MAVYEDSSKGQVRVTAYVLQLGEGNGSVAVAAPPSLELNYTRRKGPANFRPRPFHALLDRDEEMAAIKSALQASQAVSIFGPAGIGKTSLLRSLAYLPEMDQYPDGVLYLTGNFLGLEDILQSVFDAFYESREDFKPSGAEIRAALQGINALILLDDLELDRDGVKDLLSGAPECVFVLASEKQDIPGTGEKIQLEGLPADEALDLFVLELNHSLNITEQAEVREICRSLEWRPLRILQTASLVREKAATISAVRSQLLQNPSEVVILQNSFKVISDSQKNLISILAAAGGAPVPLKLLEGLSQSAELKSDLQMLVSLGLVQTHDSSFSLAENMLATIAHGLKVPSSEDRLAGFLGDWLAKQPDQDLLEASTALLVHVLQDAEQKGRWQDALRLGRGVEKSLILSCRWQAWQGSLYSVLTAARALEDRMAEAWALHQLGTRAACLGQWEPGREFLLQALAIRQSIGDRAGMAVTRHNLRLFFDLQLPAGARQAGLRRWMTCGAIGFGVIVVVAVILGGLLIKGSNRLNIPVPLASPTATAQALLTPTKPPQVNFSATLPVQPAFTPSLEPDPLILADFVSQAEEAIWESSETFDPDDNVVGDCDLTFAAPPVERCGFARRENASLEDGSLLQNVLVVEPYHTNGALIRGTYDLTGITLREGDRLVTVVGFLKSAVTFGAAFRVTFVAAGPNLSPLVVYETRDRNDGQLIGAVTSLPRELAGQSGYFILQVLAAPNTDANWASWVVARLERP